MDDVKTIVITGGTRGIGLAAAVHLLDLGHQVAVSYVDSVGSAAALEERYGEQVLTFQGSIAIPEDNQRFLDAVLTRFGRIDALVNNASLSLFGMLADATDEEIRRIVDTNILGTLSVTRLMIPSLLRARGLIVNIGSVWGFKGASCESVYAMTKGAVSQLTTSLARELGPSGVRALTVAPGLIDTDMNAGLDLEEFIREIPLGRMGTPAEVARLIAFLLDSTYLNGATLAIDGGWSA